MSFHATGWTKEIVDCPNGEAISRQEKLILFCLADYYSESRGYAWAPEDKLAREALLSPRQIRRHLRALERKRLIRVHRTGRVNRYELLKPVDNSVHKFVENSARKLTPVKAMTDLTGHLRSADRSKL
jgi:DNA-binding transcriptional ArsR family regulator